MENKDITKIQATYLDDVFVIPQDEIIYRLDYKGRRYYVKVENDKQIIKPSVTSIISRYHPMSPYLLEWYANLGMEKVREILAETSLYGTWMHIIFAELLLKNQIDLSDIGLTQELHEYLINENILLDFNHFKYDEKQWFKNIRQDILGFIQWVQDYKIKPWFIELTLHGETYSGTIDLGCQATFSIYNRSTKEYDLVNKNILVDFKSGRKDFYDSYAIQLEAYSWLVKNKFADLHFDEIWSYGCKDYRLPLGKSVTPYRFENMTGDPACKKWKYYLAMQLEDEPEVKIEPKTEIKDIAVNIETLIDDCIEEINPLEFGEEDAGIHSDK